LDGRAEILDVETTSPKRRIALRSHQQVAAGVAFDQRNSLLVVERASYPKIENAIQVYDTKTGSKIKTIGEYFSFGYKCAFSDDGALLSTCQKNVAALYELPSGRLRTRLHSHHADIGHTAFSSTEPMLAAGVDGGVELWSTATGQEIGFLSGLGRDNGPLAFSADGRLLIIVSRQPGNVGVWDIQQRERLFTLPLPLHPADQWTLAVSPDGEKVACSVKGPASGGVVYLFGGLPSDSRGSSVVPTARQTETGSGHD
jgi:WD40 repeat protein